MYVLTYNDQVFLGPMIWRSKMFESVILDDYELVVTIPTTNPASSRVDVTAEIVIRPVEFTTPPTFNSKIERLAGPFYSCQPDKVTGSYTVEDMPIASVRNQLKAIVANNRWQEESAGITVNIQGTDVFIDTAKGARDIFIQAFQLGVNNVQWKFNDTWLTLTNAELETIVQSALAYVQAQFSWEGDKVAEIDACTTLAELDLVVLEPAQ